MVDKHLGDQIPEFGDKSAAGEDQSVGITNLSAFSSGPGIKTFWEVLAIVLVAVVIIGGAEFAIRYFEVPKYVLPPPSAIVMALFTDFEFIGPHLGHTLVELVTGAPVMPATLSGVF